MIHTNYPTMELPTFIGGAEHFQLKLVEGLVRDYGHEVTIVRGVPSDKKAYTIIENGTKIYALPIRRPYWLYDGKLRNFFEKFIWHGIDDLGKVPKDFEKILETESPNIILLGNIVGLGHEVLTLAKRYNIPSCQILHDFYYTCPRMTRFHKGKACTKTCMSCWILTRKRRKSLLQADYFAAVSKFMANKFENLLGISNINVIYNGIEIQTSIRAKTSKTNELKVGYLGRISEEKGIDVLLDAIKMLDFAVTLQIAGAGSSDYINSLSKMLPNNIEFIGKVNVPTDFLSNLDVLVVPSKWDEPFGRVSIEAQMVGVPVIVADRGGLPETVDEGVSGFIVEPDAQQIAEKLDLLAKDHEIRRKMGEHAKQNSKKFSEALVIEEVNKIINRTAEHLKF